MTYGILGAGQLARMLVNAAAELKISVRVLAKSTEEPAASASIDPSHITLGEWSDPKSLEKFLSECDRFGNKFIFKNEFIIFFH